MKIRIENTGEIREIEKNYKIEKDIVIHRDYYDKRKWVVTHYPTGAIIYTDRFNNTKKETTQRFMAWVKTIYKNLENLYKEIQEIALDNNYKKIN